MMMRILITGSSGMLGQAICKKLAGQHEVVGIDIKELSAFSSQLSTFYKIDITDRDLAIQRVEEINPEFVIHCASYTDVDGCELNSQKAHELNVTATATITEGCKLTSSYMIYLSTDFIFDGKKSSPYAEKDKPNPINIYGKTKLKGENAVKDMLDKYLIIRTSWLFGKGGKNFVDIILNKAKKEKKLKVVDDQIGRPTYTVDLSEAIAGIISGLRIKNSGLSLLNITNAGSCSWYEFAREIIRLAGIKDVEIIPASSEELGRPARRPKMSILDNTQFHQIYGKNLPSWEDGLKRYLKERKDSQ